MNAAWGRDPRFAWLVAASAVVIVGLGAGLARDVGRLYPGFFFAPDYRIFPVTPAAAAAGLASGDRIVAVNGRDPLTLLAQVRAARGPVRYEVERGGRRFTAALTPEPFTWPLLAQRFAGYFVVSAVMLAMGLFVFAQNAAALPNQRFLVYMCLWAVSNVAVPEAVLGPDKHGAWMLGMLPVLLAVHGWVFFLTYPVNPAREAWLERHRVIPRLYRAAFAVGTVVTVAYAGARIAAPEVLADGGLYDAAAAFQSTLSWISFPIKVGALIDTRRRAASPLVFGAFLDEIVKHGGDVNETAGDGLMVIFHEGDHARAAVDAARAIHLRARDLNGEGLAGSDPLAMHIGVNTGLALLGATKIEGRAGTRWTYTASGLTTNIAARLSAVAREGEIVLSETTLGRLGGAVPVEDLGLRELKNVDAPLRLYRVSP